MAELIKLANGKEDLLFHAQPTNFSRVERVQHKGVHFIIKVNKNDAVYDILRSEVLSWKENEKGKKVPNEIDVHRDTDLYVKIYGNPFKIALNKVISEVEFLNA